MLRTAGGSPNQPEGSGPVCRQTGFPTERSSMSPWTVNSLVNSRGCTGLPVRSGLACPIRGLMRGARVGGEGSTAFLASGSPPLASLTKPPLTPQAELSLPFPKGPWSHVQATHWRRRAAVPECPRLGALRPPSCGGRMPGRKVFSRGAFSDLRARHSSQPPIPGCLPRTLTVSSSVCVCVCLYLNFPFLRTPGILD